MSLSSLVEKAINNPIQDGGTVPAIAGEVSSPLSQAREAAFINLADTTEQEEESPGAKFGIDKINAMNAKVLKERLTREAIERRKQEVAAIEEEIMNSPMTSGAAFETIRDIRESIYSGVAPEDLAIQELSAKNIAEAEEYNQQDIALMQAIESEKKWSIDNMLTQLRDSIDDELEPTIPGVETAYEHLASWFMYPKSAGTNVAGLMEDMFGVKIGFFESLAPGNRIPEMQKLFSSMSHQERVAAIKRAKDSILSRQGILFDNEADAMVMVNVVEAIAGSRVQAEAARVSSTTGQFIDTLLTISGLRPIKAASKLVNKAGKVRPGSIISDDIAEAVARGEGSLTIGDDIMPTRAQVIEERAEAAILNGQPSKLDRVRRRQEIVRPRLTKKRARAPHTGMPAFSPAQILNDVSPRTAGPILSDAINNLDGTIAKGIGATRAQIAEDTIVPMVIGEPIRKGASLIAPAISNSMSDAGANIINLMHDVKLYTPDEINRVVDNIGKIGNNLVSDEVTLIEKSTPYINELQGKVSMVYTIGAGEGRSFATAAEARGFLTRLPSERMNNVEVLKYSPEENAYIKYTGDVEERGEYLLSAEYVHPMTSGASKEDILRNDTVNFLTNYADSSVAFIERVSKGISRLDIRHAQVNQMFKDILKPLQALKTKDDLDDVWSTLKDAEKQPVDFTQGQLTRRLGGSQPKVEAYRAVRQFYQAVYEIRNFQYRQFLSDRGYLVHKHPDGTNNWVKPVTDSDEVVTVWWDESGTIVDKQKLIDEEVEFDLLQSFQPRSFVKKGQTPQYSQYVAVRKGQTSLDALPSQVLYNKETYLGRHMQAQYVIERMEDSVVNGTKRKMGTVVAVANNPVDAARASAKERGLEWRRAIELTESDVTFVEQELKHMHDLQMLTNTKYRMDFEQMDITRQNAIMSPMESLDRVRYTMARSSVLNEWVDYNTTKWYRTYGHLIKEKGFPWGGKINLKDDLATDPEAKRQLARARAVRERIQLVTGVHDIQIGERIQQQLLGAGEWLARAGANAIKKGDANLLRSMQIGTLSHTASLLTWLGGMNFVNKAKGLAHLSFIIANPLRQLVMQSSSALMYGGVQHGSKYMATGAAARDFAFLATAKSYKDIDLDSFNKVVEKYAKVAKVSTKEAELFFKQFEDSATLGSVTGHQFLEHGFRAGGTYRNHAGTYAGDLPPNILGKIGHSTKGAWDAGVRTSAHLGFEAGEKGHRIMAYLVTRNKHKMNGTLEGMDATELGTDALRLAGNMGQYNKSSFQSGALGLPFQFLSHTTRMLQYMTPHSKWTSWIASDVLSNQEKARIGLWNAAMFGTGGLGLGSLFMDSAKNQGIEIDPDVQNALEEGLAGLAFESVIEGLTGEEANINFSGTIGPLSGITGNVQVVFGDGERAATPIGSAYRVLADLATGMPVNFDDLAGASSGAMGNVLGIVKNINKIWMNPVFSIGEKFELQARDVAIMLPVVNNVLQARIMASTGEYASKYGTPVAQVTIAEALSKGLIGIGPEHVKDTYDINAELRGRRAVLLQPTHKELSQSGRDVASFTYNAFRSLSNGQMTDQEVMDRIEASRAALFQAYKNQTDRDIFQAAMRKELIRLMGSKELLSDQLVRLMATDEELTHEMGWDKITTKIEKLGPSEYRQHVLDTMRRIKQNEEGSKLTFEPEE